jgi:hypothetical protein
MTETPSDWAAGNREQPTDEWFSEEMGNDRDHDGKDKSKDNTAFAFRNVYE